MSAYNWIEFEGVCPNCGQNSKIRSQTHMCSDFDGDDTGRFHDRTYKLGEQMAWWPESDERFSYWKEDNRSLDFNGEEGTYTYDDSFECCYSECLKCGSDLYVIIKFVKCAPVNVSELGLESKWPVGYLK